MALLLVAVGVVVRVVLSIRGEGRCRRVATLILVVSFLRRE